MNLNYQEKKSYCLGKYSNYTKINYGNNLKS